VKESVVMVHLEAVKVNLAMADLDHLTPLAVTVTVIVGLAMMAVMADLAVMVDIAEVLRESKVAAVVMLDLRMTSIQSQKAPANSAIVA
jgi:hypothetical protein